MEPEQAVQRCLDLGAEHAQVRWQSVREARLEVEDGELRRSAAGQEAGFALRVLVDGAWGFASSNDLGNKAWARAAQQAVRLGKAAAAASKHKVALADVPSMRARVRWQPKIDPVGVDEEDKLALLRDLDRAVRVLPEVASVSAAYRDATVETRIVTSEGTDVSWEMTRTVAHATFTAKRDGELAGRSTRVGATRGWETFSLEDPIEKAVRAAEATVAALGAPAAKGGKQTVVMDGELAGVFAHEAVGHAAEADLVVAGDSCFKGRLGDQVGIEGLTIRDDSSLEGAFGSFPFDDDGVEGRSRPIVTDGRLTGLLADREHAAALGVEATGSARAESFAARPLVRMSNTLIEPGDHPEDEVFEGIKDGVYCRGSRGGQVDTARGTFLFNAQDAFVIRDGEIAEPLRDVSLTGSILGTLHNIQALGDRQHLGDPGYCGKGQWVPVCDGGPLVRVADCLVGGAA
ncbi:MAG: TldD/PmbA family protein [Thermoplasmatota archaeon]